MQKNILITGNTGYIGSVMTKYFGDMGQNVVGLDTDYYKGCEFFNPNGKVIRQIYKDIRDITKEDLTGINTIIHLAALSNDPLGELNPNLTDDINAEASIRLAKLARESGVERFIFSSSCSIYGIADNTEALKETDKLNPITAYAIAKAKVEKEVTKLADNSFHPVFMRNATVYGLSPLLRLDLVVNNLTASAYCTGKVSIMSDGTPWRPIIHVQDFCNAFLAVSQAPIQDIHNQVFNVGQNKENYQIKDIANYVKEIVPNSKVEILNKTGSDERTYKVDFSKIAGVIKSFTPRFNVKMGIEEMYKAYKDFKLTEKDIQDVRYFRLRWIRRLVETNQVDNNLKRIYQTNAKG